MKLDKRHIILLIQSLRRGLLLILLFTCGILPSITFIALAQTSIGSAKCDFYFANIEDLAPAVIVCPGGSYSWLDTEAEGVVVAQWLQREGISAFVLHYPVQGVLSFWSHYRYLFRGYQHPDALDALQATISMIRSNYKQYHIDPQCVGVMGFSAGGHLAILSAEFSTCANNRPDFVVSVYPVVTLRQNPWVHKRSRRALLGEYRKRQPIWQDSLSLELHVRPDMPPVFLVNCLDDPVVHYHNSEMLDSALTVVGVAHEYHQYKTGGHGFGACESKASAECIEWKKAFISWFHSLFKIN